MPDLERRDYIVIAGKTEKNLEWIGCSGFYNGTFVNPFLDIPPTGHLAHIRFHEFYRFQEDRVIEVQALWDIPELMMQSNSWPLSPSLGKEWCIPSPATLDGISDKPYNLATRVIKDDRPFHPQRFWDVCQKYLDKRIYRSKGFFWLASRNKHSLLWNQAGGGISLELIGIWRSAVAEDKNHGLLETEIQSLKEKLKEEPGRFGDRRCDLTVIGNKEQIDKFTVKLKSCFLTDDEIKLYNNGHIFKDPWPKNIVKIRNE